MSQNNFIEEGNTRSVMIESRISPGKDIEGDKLKQQNKAMLHYDNFSENREESALLTNQAYQSASKESYTLYKYDESWHSKVKDAKRDHKIILIKIFIQEFPQLSLQNANFTSAFNLINVTINDKNHHVVMETLKMISVMAKGLGKLFNATAKKHFKNIIYKFRDTNPQTMKVTFEYLNDLFNCLSIQEVLDKVKQGLNDGSPNMRKNMANWTKGHLSRKIQQIQEQSQKRGEL